MNAPLARRGASPYARRLARERGLALDTLSGSGPGGRIVAADILAFVAVPVPVPASAPVAAPEPPPVPLPQPARPIGAFQATADLAPLAALIAASESGLGIEPFLIKAVARAAGAHGMAIDFAGPAGRAGKITGAAGLTPSEVERRLGDDEIGAATLSLVVLNAAGIRPVATGLAATVALKLVVVAGMESAELLLAHDEAAVAAADAVAILAAFRALVEAPLRLLV